MRLRGSALLPSFMMGLSCPVRLQPARNSHEPGADFLPHYVRRGGRRGSSPTSNCNNQASTSVFEWHSPDLLAEPVAAGVNFGWSQFGDLISIPLCRVGCDVRVWGLLQKEPRNF